MKDAFNSDREFSGRFQVRIRPDLHKRLFEISNGMNCAINDVIELSADFALNQEEFIYYLDDFVHGIVMVVENGFPIASIVRRNLISFSYRDSNNISICIKVKRGSVWLQAQVVADLDQNPRLLGRLQEWSIPH